MLPFTGDEVTVEHPGYVADQYQNLTPSFDEDAEGYSTATVPAHVQPGGNARQGGGSTETRGSGDRNQVVTTIKVWIEPGTHVCAQCRLTWQALSWDVQGDPQQWSSPLVPGHTEIRAVRSAG